MKANYIIDKQVPRKKKMVMTKDEISSYLNVEWEERKDAIYEEVKRDVSSQILAVFFTALNKDFGFGKKRLLQVKESVECYFALMQPGNIFGDSFSPLDCIAYIKDKFGIDIDKENQRE